MKSNGFEDHILVFRLILKLYSMKMIEIDNMVEDESDLLTPNKE